MNALPLVMVFFLPPGDGPTDATAVADANADGPNVAAAKAALAPLNPLVGQWRGVGQVRRGSREGAWRETAEWVWDFSDPNRPAVRFEVEEGKETLRLLVRPASDGKGAVGKGFVGQFTPPGGKTATLSAASLGDTVTFEPKEDGSDRLTFKRLSDKRFTLLIERRSSPTGRFLRVAEVGYTRAGERLAESSLGGPECVVTGGLGTIAVEHAGKTYYVCCTGCVAAFEADPEGTLAEYRAKRAQSAQPAGAAAGGSDE
ncbi:hypothetical protein [Alienimonas californiensis]|uniref:YHS domain protein n=1 Tax=Alienimonas californiensis TaxID=2527989 RepID=A0A517PAF1_9PLAN|nr:hypothetical protein [Alienimonas californiensis]QDT16343.1 hypothetical protein CA12_24440 [Alienimonas californiensis]